MSAPEIDGAAEADIRGRAEIVRCGLPAMMKLEKQSRVLDVLARERIVEVEQPRLKIRLDLLGGHGIVRDEVPDR